MRWLNRVNCTFKKVRLALTVSSDDNIDPGVETGNGLILVGLEILKDDGLHLKLR